MIDWPKISIITPSFNQGRYLERTINSIIDQDYPNLEYIIIDGGSNDGSVDIIKKYSSRIAFWVSEPDKGQAHALNKGFTLATGEIIGWLNSDDLYCPGALSLVARTINEFPYADACFGGIFIIDESDRIKNAIWPVEPVPAYNFHVGLSIHQQGLFWRRDLFSRIGMLDESLHFAMDLDFIIRILLNGGLSRICKHIGMFRVHNDSKTSSANVLNNQEHLIIKERYGANFPVSIPEHLYRTSLRLQHLLAVIEDAPLSYLRFKCECLIGIHSRPYWQNV